MSDVKIAAGQTIFAQDDAANEAYIIDSGEVELIKLGQSGEVKMADLGKGDVFGEIALFEKNAAYLTVARAKSDSQLQSITRAEFEQLLGQTPQQLHPIIQKMLSLIRNSSQAVVKKDEPLEAVLGIDIEKVLVSSANEPALFHPVEMSAVRLPLRIGGYFHEDGQDRRHKQNHVNIASGVSPPVVSPQHCQIEVHEGGVHLRELGSRFTTIVNGEQIGRGKGRYILPLQKGKNKVQLGGIDSQVHINVECL